MICVIFCYLSKFFLNSVSTKLYIKLSSFQLPTISNLWNHYLGEEEDSKGKKFIESEEKGNFNGRLKAWKQAHVMNMISVGSDDKWLYTMHSKYL